MYKTICETLEAFDKGLIGAEDDLTDLDEILERKADALPRAPEQLSTGNLFDQRERPTASRYLHRGNRGDTRPVSMSSKASSSSASSVPRTAIGRKTVQPSVRVYKRTTSSTTAYRKPSNLLHGLFQGFDNSNSSASRSDEEDENEDVRPSIEVGARRARARYQEVIEISSDSESESESKSNSDSGGRG